MNNSRKLLGSISLITISYLMSRVLGFFREIHWRLISSKKEIAAAKQKEEIKAGSKKRVHRKLVRRSHFLTIIAAWVITVPAAALLSGILFLALNNLI